MSDEKKKFDLILKLSEDQKKKIFSDLAKRRAEIKSKPSPKVNRIQCPDRSCSINVFKAGKPPKLRFRPGNILKLKSTGDQIYQIAYCFRIKRDPTEWKYHLEEIKSLSPSKDLDDIGHIAKAMKIGETTPRIVYDLFRDEYQAMQYFFDVPINGSSMTVSNKKMVQEATLISSGELE